MRVDAARDGCKQGGASRAQPESRTHLPLHLPVPLFEDLQPSDKVLYTELLLRQCLLLSVPLAEQGHHLVRRRLRLGKDLNTKVQVFYYLLLRLLCLLQLAAFLL